jgi:putative membrane protein
VARAINFLIRSSPRQLDIEDAAYEENTAPELREMFASEFRGSEIAKGAVAGALAGLFAGWAMVKFQEAWARVAEGREESRNLRNDVPEHRTKPDADSDGRKKEEPSRARDETSDDATIRTAEAISEKVFHHELTRSEKKVAGPAVHYAFSAGMGALYGAAAEVSPNATAGFGTAFGAVLFVVADEIAVPALGLSQNKQEVPLSEHFYGFVSHLVYGAATEAVRRPMRAALGTS